MRQYGQSFWTILKLALPNHWLCGSVDDAPETHSDKRFPDEEPREIGGKRYGLRTALKGRNTAAA